MSSSTLWQAVIQKTCLKINRENTIHRHSKGATRSGYNSDIILTYHVWRDNALRTLALRSLLLHAKDRHFRRQVPELDCSPDQRHKAVRSTRPKKDCGESGRRLMLKKKKQSAEKCVIIDNILID